MSRMHRTETDAEKCSQTFRTRKARWTVECVRSFAFVERPGNKAWRRAPVSTVVSQRV